MELGKAIWGTAVAACIILPGWTALYLYQVSEVDPPAVQPVWFSHANHKARGVECVDCHRTFRETRHAGRPTKKECLECHDEPLGESEHEKRLLEILRSDKPLDWSPLYELPAHVNFSHMRHVTVAKVECAECHGDIGESKEMPDRPVVRNTLWMDRCLECHERQGVTRDCYACHR